jgi:hypothetical protein
MNRRVYSLVAALFTALVLAGGLMHLSAQAPAQIDLNAGSPIKLTLDDQVGKRVRLKLISGQDVEGQVTRVGSQAVFVTQLTGMEFYNATVRMDQIAAVIVRAPGR